MILGLSLILAFLTYLIYRRLLLSTDSSSTSSITGTGSSRNSSQSYQVFPMWPFLSTLLQQQSTTSTTTTTSTSATVGPSSTAKRPFPTCQPTTISTSAANSATTTTTTTTLRANDYHGRSPVAPAQYAASPETTPKAIPAAPAIAIDAIPPVTLELTPPSITINVDAEDEDDTYIPSFPSINSAQRASPSSSASLMSTTHSAKPAAPMAPPPIPIRGRNPKANVRYATPTTTATPSAAAVARQNPNGAARSRLTAMGVGASGVAAGSGLSLPGRGGQSNNSNRKKVVLEPGHSPLDWARLQRSGIDLRGLPHSNLIKVPPSLLAKHAKAPEDIWTALNGRVYNITAYLPFHPGGEKDLLRGAGKDSTKLFNATHPWVNVEGMLAECLIGIFVSEEEAAAGLDEDESPLDTVD
ncbi:uncharacterized protein H6S33_011842 [Morchella sextelata]|uniref:uncharacterized protein n=1 Tax=Morchella sextelata TaxID=1174677 RepID=UPI001D056A8E|nr:uncharacterized protein H6S33_011842 [Morchella sextelata]KAH0610315.1 hypothetical protein H6S33_011842 [Morchella sextelata]